MKLYTYPGNKNAFKALIVAQYAGVSIEQPAYEWGVTNRSDQFLKLFPLGKVPALETPEGGVFESNAIARYIARTGGGSLLGSTPYQQALVDQWVEFATTEVDANVNAWLQPLKWPSYFPHHAKKEEQIKNNLKRALAALEAHLAAAGGRAFLVGDSVTLADIILVCNLYNGFTALFDPAFRADFPNVERYFLAQVAQPQFHAVIGDVKLAEKTLEAAATA